MRISVYEQLERDRAAARRAQLAAERREGEIASMRCALASIGLDLALVRLQRALARKYRPDQPRVPAGNPEGGQWTSSDQSRDMDATGSIGRTRIAQNESERRYSVNLAEEEARGGHTIRKHVGKSDAEMLDGAKAWDYGVPGVTRRYYRHGSFRSLEDANDLTNQAL
jgi:hypothetical protein